eukprot:gb/GECG01000814.1/.p1 GENE.gb/GECG01000814.1/~~gb/GECG01000814.1/.p1  ORF type:complete len:916 (+),score=105.91 gb/GECG01000814.1/:1-2748(+)
MEPLRHRGSNGPGNTGGSSPRPSSPSPLAHQQQSHSSSAHQSASSKEAPRVSSLRQHRKAKQEGEEEEDNVGLQLLSSSPSSSSPYETDSSPSEALTHASTSYMSSPFRAAGATVPKEGVNGEGVVCNEGLSHLIRATRGCVEACEKTRRLVDEDSELLDAYHIHEDIREVSLSLATLDRSLCSFCCEVLEEAGGVSTELSKSDLASIIDQIQHLPASIQLKKLPPGGLTSLLYHFHVTLDEANKIMDSIKPSWMIGLIRWVYPIATFLCMVAIHRKVLTASSKAFRRRWPASLALGLLAILLYRRLQHNTSALRARLRQMHKQLLLLLRIWLISVDVFKTANISKNKSYALMLGNVSEMSRPKPTARKLLEEAYLPQDAMLWCKRNPALAWLKYGLDCIYAGFGLGFQCGRNVTWALEWPASIVAIVYFACRPESASQYAGKTLKGCPVEFVQRVWRLLDSTPARMLAGLTLPDLNFNEALNIAGASCHLFSADSNGLEIRKLSKLQACPFPEALLQAADGMVGTNEQVPHPSNSTSSGNGLHGRRVTNPSLVNIQPPMKRFKFRQTLGTILSPDIENTSPDKAGDIESIKLPPAQSNVGRVAHSSSSTQTAQAQASFERRSLSSVGLGYFNENGEFTPSSELSAQWKRTPEKEKERFQTMSEKKISPGEVVSNVKVSSDGEIEEYDLSSPLMYQGSSPEAEDTEENNQGPPTLLYVHGGGFVGSSFASDAVFLSKWAKESGFSVVFAHYSLAPQHIFPTALNECMTLYQALRYKARCRRIVVAGESAGGHIATALVIRCITSGVQVPDGLVLGYPSLNLNEVTGPSRALHLNDPLVPMGLLTTLANAYKPEFARNSPTDNAYLHPGCATDRVLQYVMPKNSNVAGILFMLSNNYLQVLPDNVHCGRRARPTAR